MTITLAVFTDGRHDCLARTLESAKSMLTGDITHRLMVNDSPEHVDRLLLDNLYGDTFTILHPTDGRRGFGGAIAAAWAVMPATDFVFHLEDDFTINRPVHLDALAAVLEQRPELVQLALRRQPWNKAERAAGGIVEQWPDKYEEVRLSTCTSACARPAGADCPQCDSSLAWLEHRLFFTTNPSLYRRSLCELGWPAGERSEERFTVEVLQNLDARFGFWGARDSGEWVHHIGAERVGTGY